MFLTASNMAHYLLARGTIPPAVVVDGDFMVIEAGRRNRQSDAPNSHQSRRVNQNH